MILTYSGMQIFLRFNRYMVECEFVVLTNVARIGHVLIDTWWNVNFI